MIPPPPPPQKKKFRLPFLRIGQFRDLRTVTVMAPARLPGLSFSASGRALTPPREPSGTGRRQPLYVVFRLAETCVFGKQSLGPIHCGPLGSAGKRLHPTGAPLSRSLRGNFAESLTRVISITLILLAHLCRFCTGTRFLPRSFSRRYGVRDSPAHEPAGIAPLGLTRPPYLPGATPTCLPQGNHRRASLAFLVPPSVKRMRRGTGISTCWPSTTPFGLALGPD